MGGIGEIWLHWLCLRNLSVHLLWVKIIEGGHGVNRIAQQGNSVLARLKIFTVHRLDNTLHGMFVAFRCHISICVFIAEKKDPEVGHQIAKTEMIREGLCKYLIKVLQIPYLLSCRAWFSPL